MDAILERVGEGVQRVLAAWDIVDTVTVLRFGSDRYDPSFFVSFDVYYHGSLPSAAEREEQFAFTSAYETTVDGQKDRFLHEDVPVRVEYKAIRDVDFQVSKARNPDIGDPVRSTYGFYRLVHSEPVLLRSNWLTVVRRTLAELPDRFWERRVRTLRARMEHTFVDLSSAVYSEEELFAQLSLARFVESVCELLFALNRRFEPAGRGIRAELMDLATLPEEFETRLDHLIGTNSRVGGKRKREIAQLLTRSLLRLS